MNQIKNSHDGLNEMFQHLGVQRPIVPSIAEIAEWRRGTSASRLFLPPIQRSLVWSNEQIINYWDSLLRGYPAGMMMVHRVPPAADAASCKGVDSDGRTCSVNDRDFYLFDGQQRMATVLLGLGEGQLKGNRRLWVDVGVWPRAEAGRKFQLRITTPGQPFGYQPDHPNYKLELSVRQEQWRKWQEAHGSERAGAFHGVTGHDLLRAVCAVPLSEVCELLCSAGKEACVDWLVHQPDAQADLAEDFVVALTRALATQVIVQQVDDAIVTDYDEYIRFFARVGQGGTRLSDDELTYSIIKNAYPEIRDRMESIMDGGAGRLADEVDLVLAALRVAKTVARWNSATEGQVISRPSPDFVSRLKDKDKMEVNEKFLSMLPEIPTSGSLQIHLEGIRRALAYDARDHPRGLPAALLARLPKELIDVLLLFAERRIEEHWNPNDSALLTAFSLHWLLFVGTEYKAALQAFQNARQPEWRLQRESLRNLIELWEKEGVARPVPTKRDMDAIDKGIEDTRSVAALRSPNECFTEADRAESDKPGESVRVLSTNNELIKRSLLWLQRRYVGQELFAHYDPTHRQDEDLPWDLDHIIPQDCFSFDWRIRERRLDADFRGNSEAVENFRSLRSRVGNSLGNYRWIDASSNRKRQAGEFIPLNDGLDLVDADQMPEWNGLIHGISNKPWGTNEVARFQYLINSRSLQLLNCLLKDSGIRELITS